MGSYQFYDGKIFIYGLVQGFHTLLCKWWCFYLESTAILFTYIFYGLVVFAVVVVVGIHLAGAVVICAVAIAVEVVVGAVVVTAKIIVGGCAYNSPKSKPLK